MHVYQTGLIKGLHHDQKSIVFIVVHPRLNGMEKRLKQNPVFTARLAAKHSFGKDLIAKDARNNIGLNSGSMKAIRSDNFAISQGTAKINSSESKILGSTVNLNRGLTMRPSNTFYLTALTFTNKVV